MNRKTIVRSVLAISAFLGLTFNVFAQGTYMIDPTHSSVGFAVKHLGVSTVKGQFNEFEGTIQFDETQPGALAVDVTVQVASIDTNQPKRDDHLRSADFFGVEQFPQITFKSVNVNKEGERYLVEGDLTIHGVTKRVTIPLEIAGPVKSPAGEQIIGLTGETTINRQDFGVSWSKNLDTGGLVVSDEVRILVEVEAIRKQ